jgi:hypothetical protein
MVADTFAQPMMSSSPQGQSQISAQGLDSVAVKGFFRRQLASVHQKISPKFADRTSSRMRQSIAP